MNDYDRNNLDFIMKLDRDRVEAWFDEMDDEDREYAQSLLDQYEEELNIKEVMTDNLYIKDLTQAKNIINKIRYSV